MKANKQTLNEFYRLSGIKPLINENIWDRGDDYTVKLNNIKDAIINPTIDNNYLKLVLTYINESRSKNEILELFERFNEYIDLDDVAMDLYHNVDYDALFLILDIYKFEVGPILFEEIVSNLTNHELYILCEQILVNKQLKNTHIKILTKILNSGSLLSDFKIPIIKYLIVKELSKNGGLDELDEFINGELDNGYEGEELIYNLVKDGIITIPNDIAEEIINDPDYEFNVNKRQFYKMVKNAYVDNQHDDDDADKDDYKYYDREY